MNDERENSLTPEERDAFDSLPREAAPPPALEANVVAALQRKGLLPSVENSVESSEATSLQPQRRWFRLALVIAASLLLGLSASLWWQTRTATPAIQTESFPRFLLVLRNPPETFRTDIPNERLRTEYTAWAGALAERGLFLEGEELGDDSRLLHPNPESDAAVSVEELAATDKTVSGYFLIRARNYKEAEAIAQTCPHIGYGGAIEVRPLPEN